MSNVTKTVVSNAVENEAEIKRPVVARTMKQAKPTEYAKLKAARRVRKQARRKMLKAMGFRPNARMNKCKKTGTILAISKVTMDELRKIAPHGGDTLPVDQQHGIGVK